MRIALEAKLLYDMLDVMHFIVDNPNLDEGTSELLTGQAHALSIAMNKAPWVISNYTKEEKKE